jgi:hypothetical protein
MKKVTNFLYRINLSRLLANHLVGKEHNVIHQRIVGVCVMIIGVLVAKLSLLVGHDLLIHITADVVGYGLHGIGLVPFVSRLES